MRGFGAAAHGGARHAFQAPLNFSSSLLVNMAVMRLATITNWAYGATVALTLASASTMILAGSAHDEERRAVEQRHQLDQATSRLDTEIYKLTDQAREYVITGDPVYLDIYHREVEQLAAIEQRIAEIENRGATQDELEALAESIRWADTLQAQQEVAIAAYRAGNAERAREILFGPEYERELGRVDAMVQRFQYRLDQRTANEIAEAESAAQLWRRFSEVVLVVTALLFFGVLFFILRQRILHPVVRLSDVVKRLAAQDYQVEPPDFGHIDEIGDMAGAIRIFRENGLERQRLEQERAADGEKRDLLSRMIQRMQGCETMADISDVVERFAPRVLPGRAGRLYALDKARGAMVEVSNWLDPLHSRGEFSPTACWALRRGVMHQPCGDEIDIPCEHLGANAGEAVNSICLPLTAQQETIGLLYIEQAERTEKQGAADDVYVQLLAENVAAVLANLRLREALREMAMTDALTTLPNRRQFDTVFAVEAEEAQKDDAALSCLLLDVDHFKRFNDTYGHEAGDAVLREIGGVLRNATREPDMAFRYGGEEFVLLLPNLEGEAAFARAEQIRRDIEALTLVHEGQNLGAVTVSIGLASRAPDIPADRLVIAADSALYKAKDAGRNRVAVAATRMRDAAA